MTDAERLRLAATTASNDDLSKPGTTARDRHIERLEAMLAAAEHIDELEQRVRELEERD